MRRSIYIFFILFSSLVVAQDNAINWLTFEELEIELINEPKKVIVEFYADWCVYCKKMEQSVFSKSEIKALLAKDYYAVRFNVETNDSIVFGGKTFVNKNAGKKRLAYHEIPELLAGRDNKALELPATVILDENFEITNRYYRYIPPKEMLSILNN